MYAPSDRSPDYWGDLVRGAYPGYAGPRPVVAIWHGSADSVVKPANAAELRDQFTDVLGIGQAPTGTASLTGGTTLTSYGPDKVRVYSVSGMGHGLPVHPGSAVQDCGNPGAYFLDTICSAYHDAEFFGLLDGGGPSDPPDPTNTSEPTNPPTCVTANNYAHTTAGRAHASGGYAYAVGSGQNLGLWSMGVSTTLQQTAPDYWVLGC